MMYTQTDTDAADDQKKREEMAMMVVAVAEPLSLPFSLLATLPPPLLLLLLLLGRPNHEHAAVWLRRPQGKREERKAMRSEGARDGSQCYCRRVCTADTANHETVSGVSGRGGGGVLALALYLAPSRL